MERSFINNVSDNREEKSGFSEDISMSKERWDEILKCKKRFFQTGDIKDLLKNPYMRPEVAESWIRSRMMGINPFTPLTEEKVDRKIFEKVKLENSLLIEITSRLFSSFKTLVKSTTSYAFYLFDKNDIALLQYGEMMRRPLDYQPIIEELKEKLNVDDIKEVKITYHHDLEGIVWKEENNGICSHILCKYLKRPVQLIGPEHYKVALHHLIASAAPILDDKGEVIAIVVLSQPLADSLWNEKWQILCSHTLGLVTTLARAIESTLKLEISNRHLEELNSYLEELNKQLQLTNNRLKLTNEKLRITQEVYEVTLAGIDDGIITIDKSGRIVHINPAAARILKVRQDEAKNKNISEFLSKSSSLMELISKAENANYVEETIFTGSNEQQSYLVNVWPVLNNKAKQIDTIVLKFVPVERVNALVTSRTGAMANYSFDDIIGESKAIKKAVALAKQFASTGENILLIGESGTGKELFAQAIHNQYRPKGPFIAVNCAALPKELIESELFGYEGGSFTGAVRSGRPGKIELADGGTLFLDEIGDMPLDLQAVLLRVLENKQIMRIGGQRYKKVDFRLIAATNRDLGQMVKEKLFREDLYYRLSVLTIKIPPLRERENDVEILAHYFVEQYCRKIGKCGLRLSNAALDLIKKFTWPGNVRQLENAIIYAVNTAQGKTIEPGDLPEFVFGAINEAERVGFSTGHLEEELYLENLEKKAIMKALAYTNNNVPLAADLLGISKSTLYRKLKEYEIRH